MVKFFAGLMTHPKVLGDQTMWSGYKCTLVFDKVRPATSAFFS